MDDKKAAKRHSKKIDKELLREKKNLPKHITILLLGGGEVGKTTIIKQMRLYNNNEFTQEEKETFAHEIRNNIHEAMYDIVSNVEKANIESDGVLQLAVEFLKLGKQPLHHYSCDYYDMIDKLWGNEQIQTVFRRGHEYHLLDSTDQFMQRLDEIRKDDYLPTVQDILYCRRLTSTITEVIFDYAVPKKYGGGNAKFSVIDVGGQRGYRSKWISRCHGINALIFIISLSDFDQYLREDNTTNRLQESLTLFENMYNSRYLQQIGTAIIFLNKCDILKNKINNGSSIKDYFPNYKEYRKYSDEVENTKMFIKNMVMDIIKASQQKRSYYIHFTVATNTEYIKPIFESVHSTLIDQAVQNLLPH